MHRLPQCGLLLACSYLASLTGCSDAPSAPPRPDLNPAECAQEAIKRYDTNGNGKIDASELDNAPALKALLAIIKYSDPNHADALSQDDIATHIKKWLDNKTSLMGGIVMVTLDGRPLEGAAVTFEPEPFLGPSYRPATGTTDSNGTAILSGSVEGSPGLFPGLYRVKISKKVGGKETIPERFNEKTTLGREVAGDLPNPREAPYFRLTGK
jgi:hypothetical protein